MSTFLKNLSLIIYLGICTTTLSRAQSYDMAAGVRLGRDVGVSVKMRVPPVDKNFTGELTVQSDYDGDEVLMTLLAAQHMPIITRRLNFYSGIGLHKGWYERTYSESVDYDEPFGVTFTGAAEVNFKRLNISMDYRPAINLSGGRRVFQSSTALTLRYMVFKRHEIFTSPREKRKRQRIKRRQQKAKDRSQSNKDWRFWKRW